MGRLSGLKYRDVVNALKKFGYTFDRNGPGSHEIFRRSSDGKKVTLPRHNKDMAEGTLRAILREAGIEVDDFLGSL